MHHEEAHHEEEHHEEIIIGPPPIQNVEITNWPIKPAFDIGNHPFREILTIILMMIVAFVLAIMIGIKSAFDKYVNPILARKLHSVLRDVVIVASVVTLILWIDWLTSFKNQINIDIDAICCGLMIFALVWLFTACILILSAQYFSTTWNSYESKIMRKGISLRIMHDILINK